MDIGTLTGQIAIEDQLSGVLSSTAQKVKQFAESFDNVFGAIAIGAGLATAAIIGTTISIVSMGEKGSVLNDVEASFNRLAIAAGSTGEALLGGLSRGVKGTVDSMVLMQSTNRLLSSGVKLTADQMQLMAATAREMGKATGVDAASGLNTLSSAMLTGNMRALKRFGIQIDLKKAEDDFAKSIGTTRDALNDAGRLEAKRVAMLEGMKTKLDVLGTSELSFKEKITQSKVSIGNWFDELNKAVAASPAVNRAFDTIKDSMLEAFGGDSQKLLEKVVGWINYFADTVTKYGPGIIRTMADIVHGIADIWHEAKDAWNWMPEWFKVIAKDATLASGAVYVAGGAFKTMGFDLLGTTASFATMTSGFRDMKAMLAGSSILFPLRLLADQIRIFGFATGVSTTATYLFSKALVGLQAAAASIGGVVTLFAALGFAMWELGGAVANFGDNWKKGGGTLWGFLTLRDEGNFIRGYDKPKSSLSGLNPADFNMAPAHLPLGRIVGNGPPVESPDYTGGGAAAAEYAKKIKELADTLSGKKVAESVKDLNAAILQMGGYSKLTAPEVTKVAESAAKFFMEGAKLNPELAKMPAVQKAIAAALDNLRPKLEVTSGLFDNFFNVIAKRSPGLAALLDKMFGVEISTHARDLNAAFKETASMGGEQLAKALKVLSVEVGAFIEAGGGGELALETFRLGIVATADSTQKALQAFWDAGEKIDVTVQKVEKVVTVWQKVGAAIDIAATILDNISGKFAEVASMALKGAGAAIAAFSSGDWVGGIVASATAAIGIIAKLIGWVDAGRKAAKDFAASFTGGFTELRQLMLALPDAGEALWKNLTQGKHSADEMKSIIAQINAALEWTPAGQGYKTIDELQAIADKTKEVYDFMVASGKYGAAAIAAAFQASKDAAIAAMSEEATAHQAAIDAITASYDEQFTEIDGKIKSLTASIADEAEEAVMGTIEIQQRTELEKLEIARKALEEKKAAEIANAEETYAATQAAAEEAAANTADAVDRELRRVFDRGYRIPITWSYPDGMPTGGSSSNAPGHAAGGVIYASTGFVPQGTDTIPAMLTPGEEVLTGAQSRDYHSGKGGKVVINIGPRFLAELIVPEIPGVVQEYELG